MKFIVLDIETAPLKIEHEEIREYLMDKKISKEIRSLDPNYSKIITIGVKILNEPIKIFYGDDEKQILNEFWSFVIDFTNKNPFYRIVTHNGYKFDIPFITLRSCVNNISIPKGIDINTNQWAMNKSNHFDTMIFFSHYGTFINPNLDVLCKLAGIEVPKERVFGADVEKLYKNGDWEKIIGHCKQDVEILEKLFEKLCLKLFQ
ncbi:ribonuclease H-like domain-containing protein [Candidatus Woesearchaeota archaeon]|nr:ribonuclease H-like domain-containing protein [Candidatus Woesearchaeota archaeon]